MADKYDDARHNAQNWYDSIVEMVADLDRARNRDVTNEEVESGEDIPDIDAAERAIHESVLSVEVRSDWRDVVIVERANPDEYRLFLTMGDPGLQLTGWLSEHGEPETAELQMQDWGVPWQAWCPEAPTGLTVEQHQVQTYDRTQTLLTFARCFYFGE